MPRLKLRPVGGGRPMHYRTRAFRDPVTACEQLCDRVLSAPETHRFAALLPPEVLPREVAERRRLAAALWGGPEGAGQALYDALVERVREAVTLAYRLGWWWQEEDDGVYAHPSGLLVVCGARTLRMVTVPHPATCIHPGPPEEGRTSGELEHVCRSRHEDPLPRDRTADTPGSGTETARYRIFRRAASEVRHHYALARWSQGRVQAPHLHARMQVTDPGTWLARLAGVRHP